MAFGAAAQVAAAVSAGYLAPDQARVLEQRIAALEARTGVEVLVALIGRCDAYPEIRWKAFGLGVALAALAVFAVLGIWLPGPVQGPSIVHTVVAILAAGAANALLAHVLPAYGRRFVGSHRAEAEARDYARALFLERALFATPHRNAVLLLAGLFEHVVVVHADERIERMATAEDWQRVADAVGPLLARGARLAAFEAGLQELSALLDRIPRAAGKSSEAPGLLGELPDRPIQEHGA